MPPPSKRCGLKFSVPLVMVSSSWSSAHPVCVPKSRARIVVFMFISNAMSDRSDPN